MLFLLLLLFICFGVYSPSYQPVVYNDVVELNAFTPSKSIYRFNNNYYLGSGSELFDSTFMTRLIRLSAVNAGTQTPTEFKVENLLLKFNTADYTYYDNGNVSMPGDIYVDTIILSTSYTGNNGHGFDFHRYSVYFKYGTTNYFSYTVEWYYPSNPSTSYDVDLSNYVFSNYESSGLRNFLFIFDRTTANNETMFNLLVDMDAYSNYDYGYSHGYGDGVDAGYNQGYQGGYTEGYQAGSSTDTTASTIFTGILNVALIPVNVFLTIFNFEVFGINISGIVSSLLTVSIVVIIIRFILGGKKDD